MDAIKAKMVKLSRETDTANARANKFDDEGEGYKKEAEKIEQQLATLTKKFQSMESQYDCAVEDLFNATIKLEEKEKVAANAEADVGSSSRRILLCWQLGLHSPMLLKLPFLSVSVAHHGKIPSFSLSEQVQ